MALSGVISGAGQAAEKGLQTVQAGMTQRMLLDERYKLEGEMQSRNQEFLKGQQESQQTFTSTENAATRTANMDVAKLHEEGANTRAEGQLAARAAETEIQDVRKSIGHAEDRADEQAKVTYQKDNYGRIIKVNARGDNVGFLTTKDKNGKETPIISGQDLDARTQKRVEVLLESIKSNAMLQREAMHQGDKEEAGRLGQLIALDRHNAEVLLGYPDTARAKPKGILVPTEFPVPSTKPKAESKPVSKPRMQSGDSYEPDWLTQMKEDLASTRKTPNQPEPKRPNMQ